LSGKKIPDLNLIPANTPASQLFLETAREISPGVWAGESERIKASDFVALLTAAGASLSVNITSLLNDRGTYSPSATYTRYDFVAYGGGHYAYINGTPGSGNAPPNVAYWVLISVDGKSAIATITDATPAPIPAVGAQATYGVDSSAGMVVGQIIGIGAAATLSVFDTPTTSSITVQNVNAAVGPVATGAKIAPAGKKGDPGLNSTVAGPAGENAFTTVTTSFTIPAFNAQVSATVGSTAFMSVGMALQISGMFFKVAAAPTNATTVSLTNSVAGQTGTIAATSKIVVSGEAGPAGTPGTSSGGVSGLQYTNLNTAGTPSAGQIRSAGINAVGASTVTISATDAQATPKSTADVLARLKVGAIIEIAASNANKVRGTITTDYSSGTNSFDWSGQVVSGAIANNATVYLSIVSDVVSGSSGGGGITFTESTALSVALVANTGVLSNTSTVRQTIVLPTGADLDINAVQGKGVGGWQVDGNGSLILLPDGSSNTGLRNDTAARYASAQLLRLDNGTWAVSQSNAISSLQLFAYAASGYDPSAQAIFNAVTAASGSLTTPQKDAIVAVITGMKANSSAKWTKTKCLYLFIGTTAGTQLINAKSPGTNNLVFSGTGTHTAQGYTSNGSTDYADTGAIPYASHRGMLSLSSSAFGSSNPGLAAGALHTSNAAGGIKGFYISRTATTIYSVADNNSEATRSVSGGIPGSLALSREDDTQYKTFVGGVLKDTIAAATNTTNTYTLPIQIGGIAGWVANSSATFSMVTIGENYTPTEISELYAIEEAYRLAR
jgi:hypothetical protein